MARDPSGRAADQTAVIVAIGGKLLTPFARIGQVRIDDILNDAPNTAALSLIAASRVGPFETAPFFAGAFDPTAFAIADNHAPILVPPPVAVGMPIAIYLGAVDPAYQVFGGFVTTREQTAEFDVPAHVRYDLTCIDFTRRLNARIGIKNYAAQSATAMVLDLIATFAPTITTKNVMAGLPTVDGGMTFTWEEMGRALSRIATAIGGYYYIDYTGDLHFFTGTEAGTDPAPIAPGADFAALKIDIDLTQVRTRTYVEGNGGTIAIAIPAGDAIVPFDTVAPFNPAGGLATTNGTRVTYASAHAGGVKANTVGVGSGGTPPPAPPGPPTVALASATTAGGLSGGPYYYLLTCELSDGARSDAGTGAGGVTIGAAANPPATNAALANPPIAGPIQAGQTATYATSFVDAAGNETIATTGGNVLTGRAIPAPVAFNMGFSLPGGGAMDVGWRFYAIVWATKGGDTMAAQANNPAQTTPGSQTVLIQSVPISTDPRVLAIKVYRSTVTAAQTGGPQLPWRYVTSIQNGAAQNYSDVTADASLPTATLPPFSTADSGGGEGATVTVPTSADPRIVARRLYRKDGSGEYRLIAQIRDNTTTSFNDTLPGVGGDLAPTVNRVTTGAVQLSALPLGPAGTVTRRIFRTTAGGAAFRELVAIGDNTTTTFLDTIPDSQLGGSPLPPQGGGNASAPPPTAIGATQIQVSTITGFPAAGWLAVDASATLVRYASVSGSGSGPFYLQGIPAAGVGSIAAAIPAGTIVATVAELIGIAPVGPASSGDTVNLLVQVDDAAAQSALAAIDGSDGVIEHYIQDRRLSAAGAQARGEADLALFANPETRVSYTTHDPNTRSGRTVSINLPAPTSLVGDFLIQKVTIADVSIAKHWYPKRTVDASTTRFSFDDVLARLLMEQH
jgi:hypothetical protein